MSLINCKNNSIFVESSIFGSVWFPYEEVNRTLGKVHNEGPDDSYCSPDIIRVNKSRWMWWAGHVARMGSWEICPGFDEETCMKRSYWRKRIEGKIRVKWILMERVWIRIIKPKKCSIYYNYILHTIYCISDMFRSILIIFREFLYIIKTTQTGYQIH